MEHIHHDMELRQDPDFRALVSLLRKQTDPDLESFYEYASHEARDERATHTSRASRKGDDYGSVDE